MNNQEKLKTKKIRNGSMMLLKGGIIIMKNNFYTCQHCKGKGLLKTTYDKEQIICLTCGIRTPIEVGDYYDEAFMDGSYVIPYWKAGKVNFTERILKG